MLFGKVSKKGRLLAVEEGNTEEIIAVEAKEGLKDMNYVIMLTILCSSILSILQKLLPNILPPSYGQQIMISLILTISNNCFNYPN